MESSDKLLQKLLQDLAPEDNLGVLLAIQMGGTPQEVQLVVQTTAYEAEKDALRITGQYIIRAIGVVEHRVSVGFFRNIVLSQDNPLLYPHNETLMLVQFEGQPESVDSLMIDLNQLYGQTYGIYDPFRRMTDELSLEKPLATLLNEGQGILGRMPQPFAEKVGRVLERHGMKSSLVETESHRPEGITYHSLVLDDSYLVAQLFSVDAVGAAASS